MDTWEISYYSDEVRIWIAKLPRDMRVHYAHLANLITEFGVKRLIFPHSRPMGGGLFELRLRGKEGISRVFYCTLIGKRIVMLHGFIKKTENTPHKELKIALRRMKEVKNEKHP